MANMQLSRVEQWLWDLCTSTGNCGNVWWTDSWVNVKTALRRRSTSRQSETTCCSSCWRYSTPTLYQCHQHGSLTITLHC